MDVSLFGTCSHVIIMTRKVDRCTEGGARILIKESSIKIEIAFGKKLKPGCHNKSLLK